MKQFTEISPDMIADSPFDLIGRTWMLITAGTEDAYNTMTASWGSLGVLWNRNTATVYVRPQRYTRQFMDSNEYFTLSFFGPDYRKALNVCGTKSGRDINKAEQAGLTPRHTGPFTFFEEASLIIFCKKLYTQDLDPACFKDSSIDGANYKAGDYHRQYIGEIIRVYQG